MENRRICESALSVFDMWGACLNLILNDLTEGKDVEEVKASIRNTMSDLGDIVVTQTLLNAVSDLGIKVVSVESDGSENTVADIFALLKSEFPEFRDSGE